MSIARTSAPILKRAVREDMSFMDAVMAGIFTVPGDGSIDYARLLRPLREAATMAGSWSRPNRIRLSPIP